jgi:uncharacterized membrane protein
MNDAIEHLQSFRDENKTEENIFDNIG